MYPGRLLTIGLIGAAIVRTAPPVPGAPAQEHVDTVRPRVVRADAPPTPVARVVRPQWLFTGAEPPPPPSRTATVFMRHAIGEPPPLPAARVVRTNINHPDYIERLLDVVRPRGAFGEPPPLPVARIVRTNINHPDYIERSQHLVRPRGAAGDSPPIPGVAAFLRRPAHLSRRPFHVNVYPRGVAGDAPPFPGGRVVRFGLEHTGATPPPVSDNLTVIRPRSAIGDAPPFPVARVERVGWQPTDSPTINATVIRPRSAIGDAPPLPAARVDRVGLQHTGAEPPPADFNLTVIHPRSAIGNAPPFPAARVDRYGLKRAAPLEANVNVTRLRSASGDAPPFPAARVDRVGFQHTGAEPPPVDVNSTVIHPRSAIGDAPPLPAARVDRYGLKRAAPLEANVNVTRLRSATGDAPPLPGPRVVRTGQTHTGQVATGVSIPSNRGFFGKQFLGAGAGGALLVWKEERFPATRAMQGILSKPDYDFTNMGLLFPQNDPTEIAYMTMEVKHGWALETALRPHVHFVQDGAAYPIFKMDYRWYENGQDPTGAFTTLTATSFAFVYVAGTLLQIAMFPEIDGTGITSISSLVDIKIYRDDNLVAGDVLAKVFDVHYRSDADGSRTEYSK